MHNLSTVITFEVIRVLKKKSFWAMVFGFPIMIGAVFGIVFLSNNATRDAADKLKEQTFSIAITDDSHLLSPQIVSTFHAKMVTKEAGVAAVKNGTVDAYFYYPADVSARHIEVYGKNVGLFENGRYSSVALALLSQSVQNTVSPQIRTVLQNAAASDTTIYRDGRAYDPFKEMILPGIFLVLFYVLMSFFAGQALTSTTEEKENRVIEMILTTIEARTLIIGKIISLIILMLIQGVLVAAPVLIGYLLFRNQLNLPNIDLSGLPVDWARIGVAAVIFALSFAFFTGVLVLIGATMPTAREANQFMGFVMIALYGPLYAVSLFISMPDAPIVRFLSLFPLTSPIPLLMRNAAGNLQPWEIAAGALILLASSIFVLILAVRVFRFGALEYSRKVSLKEMFARR
ncbi:ABC transporter permease [Candidatus Southlakia epibionticum]|jgi:ATP-dependent Na+ efflux pump|uniref:ABC transporter permease n=1 Tax=Candidatus Southlakia epibionticum TaxID=3043284 RepID=A0ABY8WVC0_9BACT|nr:ABC transporter permease [Candidatus Saccharimonadaceae bacterium ML1]